jgi:hypothetical protein
MTTAILNVEELIILRHALGLCRDGRGQKIRNFYISGLGCKDLAVCESLAERGLMVRGQAPGYCTRFSQMFMATADGIAAVMAAAPPPPPFPPNICIAGTVHVLDCYDPANPEDFDSIDEIENAIVVRFPTGRAMRAAVATGNIPPCSVLSAGSEPVTSIWEPMPGVEIRATAEALADQHILDWVTVTTKRGRRAYERGEW